MLLFGIFFFSTLILSFFFIGIMRRWEARSAGSEGVKEDVVVRDDMRWGENRYQTVGERYDTQSRQVGGLGWTQGRTQQAQRPRPAGGQEKRYQGQAQDGKSARGLQKPRPR